MRENRLLQDSLIAGAAVTPDKTALVVDADRPRLAEGMLDGIAESLLVARRDDLERDPEQLEDLPPARRGRGEDQRGRRRSRQISSAGHCFAHSAGGSLYHSWSAASSGA